MVPPNLSTAKKFWSILSALFGALALCVVVPICALLIGTLAAWVITATGLFHLGEYAAWMGIIFGLYAAYADIIVGPVAWWRLSAKKLGLAPGTRKNGTIAVGAFFSLAMLWVLWGEKAITNPANLLDVTDDGRYVLAQEYAHGSSTVYKVDTATGVAIRLPLTGHGRDSFANFSPSGGQIVFAHTDDEKNYKIMVADSSGNNPHRLLAEEGNDSWPRFSPDGRTIFFIRTEGNGFDLFSSTLEGKNIVRLTHQHYTFELGPYVQGLAVSPDRRQMLFVTLDDRLQLWSLSGAGQKPTDLLFSLPGAPSSRNYVSAYFSPDNDAILFMAASDEKEGYGYEIYRLELASRQVQKLTHNNAYASDFRLSIQGKKAAFLKWKFSRFQKLPRSFQLQLMDMQSGQVTPVNITGLPT